MLGVSLSPAIRVGAIAGVRITQDVCMPSYRARESSGTRVANRLIESPLTLESRGARTTTGWRGWLLRDKRVADRGHKQPALAASIVFRIPAPETPDRPRSEECTSVVHGDENRPSAQTGTALRQASART